MVSDQNQEVPDIFSRHSIEAQIWAAHLDGTLIGPPSGWPTSLKNLLALCLNAAHPTFIYWGLEYLQFYNGAGARLYGDRHPQALEQPMSAAWPELWDSVGSHIESVMKTGVSTIVDNVALPLQKQKHIHDERWFTHAYSPIYDGDVIVGVMAVVVETTEAMKQQAQMKTLAQERALLAKVSQKLAQSFDVSKALQNVAALLTQSFADWCQIDICTRRSGIETVAIAHRDPQKQTLAASYIGQLHLNMAVDYGSPYVIRTGEGNHIQRCSVAEIQAVDGETVEVEMYKQLGVSSILSLPLIAEDVTLGAISLIYGDSGRMYTPEDIPLMKDVAQLITIAIGNARDLQRENFIAESLQAASLPVSLPNIPGYSFDAVYQAGRAEGTVGGDWYDAVRLFDGRIVISIGDVAGSGLRAAITMGNIRQIIRGIAQVHANPAFILDAADRALRLEHPDVFATAFIAVLDPIARTLTYASAGHPPPMLCVPDGPVIALSDGGLPLGLRDGWNSTSGLSVDFPLQASLVLYTDGLTEYQREILSGEDRLRELLADNRIFETTHPAMHLHEAFFAERKAKDDVAILIVCSTCEITQDDVQSPFQEWLFDITDGTAAQSARRAFCAMLTARGADADATAAAELVFGELVGNVMRYAPGQVQIMVDWTATAPVLHVLDQGPGFQHMPLLPSDVFAESGRGLYLISTLTKDFHVAKRPHGGSHARAVLSLNREY